VKQVDDYIANADFLPPAFQLLPRLLLLLEDFESNADAVADLIRVDPGLTADILRVCNSAKFSAGYRAENIQQAILRIGFQEVQRIILTVIASPVLQDPRATYGNGEADLWNHSLAAAVASQSLASLAGVDQDLAFTASLLHDIGKVVLAHAAPAQSAAAREAAREKSQPLFQAEQELLKTDHAATGARLLQRWGFPKNMVVSIRHHHQPAGAKEEIRLAACLCLANVLSHRIENHVFFPEYVLFPDARALKELGLTEPLLRELVPEAQENFRTAQQKFI
jgi:putative nucleotidyltransferase with HDIG domain